MRYKKLGGVQSEMMNDIVPALTVTVDVTVAVTLDVKLMINPLPTAVKEASNEDNEMSLSTPACLAAGKQLWSRPTTSASKTCNLEASRAESVPLPNWFRVASAVFSTLTCTIHQSLSGYENKDIFQLETKLRANFHVFYNSNESQVIMLIAFGSRKHLNV